MYGPARKSYLQMLVSVHNQVLRVCLGAFRTSPVQSLYVDAHESVWMLDVQSYLCSMLPRSSHCLNIPDMMRCLIIHNYVKLFDARPNAIRTFGLRIKQF